MNLARTEPAPRPEGQITRTERIQPPARVAQSTESVTVPPRVTKERRTTTRSRVVGEVAVTEDQPYAPEVYVDSRPAVRYVPFDEAVTDDYRDDERPQRLRSIRIERGIPLDEEGHHEHHTKIGRFFHRLFND